VTNSDDHRRQLCTPADIDGQRQGIQDNLRSLRVGQLAAVNLRLPASERVDARFDDQLAAIAAARGPGASASSRTQARRGENPGDTLYSSWY
jgi:hypothetical protein